MGVGIRNEGVRSSQNARHRRGTLLGGTEVLGFSFGPRRASLYNTREVEGQLRWRL